MRFEQARLAAEIVTAFGYQRIGFDHFARAEDALSVAARSGRLRRNFQGYSNDDCNVLIGLGASAVSRLAQGYTQNEVAVRDYAAAVADGRLPIARGIELSPVDRVRGYAIERLMCDFRLSGADLRARFGADADPVLADVAGLTAADTDGVVTSSGETLWVTERGRPFVRSICAALDPYFATGAARHSVAV
jgi:oxygen-independent coproporphyrinogen-3 oxidase